jgi:hypothetical protein
LGFLKAQKKQRIFNMLFISPPKKTKTANLQNTTSPKLKNGVVAQNFKLAKKERRRDCQLNAPQGHSKAREAGGKNARKAGGTNCTFPPSYTQNSTKKFQNWKLKI